MIDKNDCWLFAGYKNEQGYGTISTYINHKPGYQYAHRASYETFVGAIPDGLVIDHLCKNRCCINPDHLETVTNRENIMRGEAVLSHKRITHCPRGHEYTDINTVYSNRGWRICKTCKADRREKYYIENKYRWKAYNARCYQRHKSSIVHMLY